MKNTVPRILRSTALTCLLLQASPAPSSAQTFTVDTILYNGSPSKFINLVFLGDGFLAPELPTFTANVQNFTGFLFEIQPFKEYANYFNVFAINVPSIESGASHPGTATDVTEPAFPVASVNNYFGSQFDVSAIHRLLAPNNFWALNNVLTTNFPLFDQKLLLVNSPHYGGSGGSTATASLNGSSFEIMVHEMGHSFAGLADEYYAGDGFAGERINMTKETNPALVKWKNWLNYDGVGIYQHCCGGNSDQWYRPHQGCKMRFLGTAYPFCAVCKEAIFERIHELFGTPVISYQPASNSVISCSAPIVFKLNTVKPVPNTLKINWKLNGATLPVTIDSIVVGPGQAAPGINILSATILDTSAFTRREVHFQSHQYSLNWTFQFDPAGTPSISADGPLVFCAGDSVTLSASPAASYAWSNGANTQSITVHTSGDYSVTVNNASGCSASSLPSAVMVHPTPPSPQIIATDTSLVSSAASGNQWYLDGNIIAGADMQQFTPAATGLYTVVSTDANGCTASSAPYFFMLSGLNDMDIDKAIAIIPNPNNGRFTVRAGGMPCYDLKIFNARGVLVFQRGTLSGAVEVGGLEPGTYFVECRCEGRLRRGKVVVQF